MTEGVDNKTRLEILRLIAEMPNPVGGNVLMLRLNQHGIDIGLDGVRYHLRVLDEKGLTRRISTRGRVLTELGRQELRNSLVDTRLSYALARFETLAHQVTLDPKEGTGYAVGSMIKFPEEKLGEVIQNTAVVCKAGLCTGDRVAVLRAGERVGGVLIPPGKAGLVVLSTVTVDGLLLSRGIMFRPTFAGIVEVSERRVRRFIDVLEYGRDSRDPIEILTLAGGTNVRNVVEHGQGLLIADVREVVSVARERVEYLISELAGYNLGGVLAIGQPGQPVLGVPVRPHTFGIAMIAGITPGVLSFEKGIPCEFYCIESLVDYESLRPIDSLLSEMEVASLMGMQIVRLEGW